MPEHETFTADDGHTYRLVTDDGTGDLLVRPVAPAGADIPLAAFPRQQWRTWATNSGPSGGTAGTRTDVPPSTAAIPLVLRKRVNVDHLNSIADEGLATTQARVIFHGYSAGTPYQGRDVSLLAVWLSTDGLPGESMQPGRGAWIDLTVTVSAPFRTLFLRDVRAVLHGDDVTSTNTALSFAPIPRADITLATPQHVVDRAKLIDPNTRLTTASTLLSRITAGDLRTLAAAAKALQAEGLLHPDDEW